MSLTIRNVELAGRRLDVRIEGGRIARIDHPLRGGRLELDGGGGALIPGLADHHIHLFALAAQADSVVLQGVASADAFAVRITTALAERPEGAWVRVSGYHESMAGELTRDTLDALAPRHPLRIQHQTGSLWMLNSLALDEISGGDEPSGLERDTGRLWRGDAWLRTRIRTRIPALAPVGRRLASFGVTAVTDASVTTDADGAARLAAATRCGDLPQRLMLMSGGRLEAPADGAFLVGPVKVLLDDHRLPDFADFVSHIAMARAWGRAVAGHCVTAAELALTLAAFESAGARPGDRVEHGGLISRDAIGALGALGLTVVTQPAFIRERGDRYAVEVPPAEVGDLYRCASLLTAGVPVAASSDSPYASPDPWEAIATSVDRRSAGGLCLGHSEAVSPGVALSLYLGDLRSPGGPARRIEVGVLADLCLLDAPLREVLTAPGAHRVRATLVGGEVVYEAGRA
jgi:predicted amidohydrolase YtcJ